jgi:NADH dehydrogenase
MSPPLHVVTGAFGYSGCHIAARLLAAGHRVRTITGHPERPDPFDGRVEAHPFDFDRPARLRETLAGAAAVYNTYWIRFDRGVATHARAIAHTKALIDAAAVAGVGRFVHVSITNPHLDSYLPYFRGKAELEQHLADSGLAYSVLRPTVFFGDGDILINNLAWVLRRFRLFAVAGDGRYRVQPVHVDDLADLAVREGASDGPSVTLDAVGPETYPFVELVELIAASIGRRVRVVRTPRWFMIAAAKVIGWLAGDVLLTADDVDCLMDGLLASDAPPTGRISLRGWLGEHADDVGRTLSRELERHYR